MISNIINYYNINEFTVKRSKEDLGRFVIIADKYVYKVVDSNLEKSGNRRNNTLYQEWEILKKSSTSKVTPNAVKYEHVKGCDILIIEKINGVHHKVNNFSPISDIIFMIKVKIALFKISLLGIAHNDVKLDNILISNKGVYLIDYDQSIQKKKYIAIMANLFGFEIKGSKCNYSYFYLGTEIIRVWKKRWRNSMHKNFNKFKGKSNKHNSS